MSDSRVVEHLHTVAEEDTAKGSEGAHEIGLDGDRGLDAASIGRSHETRTARHGEGQLTWSSRRLKHRMGALRCESWVEDIGASRWKVRGNSVKRNAPCMGGWTNLWKSRGATRESR